MFRLSEAGGRRILRGVGENLPKFKLYEFKLDLIFSFPNIRNVFYTTYEIHYPLAILLLFHFINLSIYRFDSMPVFINAMEGVVHKFILLRLVIAGKICCQLGVLFSACKIDGFDGHVCCWLTSYCLWSKRNFIENYLLNLTGSIGYAVCLREVNSHVQCISGASF
jgi:hypothetical protein